MKLNLRPAIASAAVLAIAGGVLAATVGMAAAATTPPWEPDPNALGSLTFFNSAGTVVTGGTNLNHLFDYAEASTPDALHGTKATLEFAQPLPGTATGNFAVGQASVATNFPNASAPAPLNTTPNPVVTLGAADGNLTNFIATQVPPTATGFVNVYQLRLVTSGAGGVGTTPNGTYWEVDILVNPSAGSWSVEFPPVVTATTTALTASPSPATVGVSDTLTATETPATARLGGLQERSHRSWIRVGQRERRRGARDHLRRSGLGEPDGDLHARPTPLTSAVRRAVWR